MKKDLNSVLIIYTGGTIGMVKNLKNGSLKPIDFNHIIDQVPELNNFDLNIDSITFNPILDSSDINPKFWIKLANTLKKHYDNYDGFVILHGTDTMAYTASALSFMLENQSKAVILTGSQLPIGTLRTDGKENLITAIEIASAKKNNQSLVPEVCIYFENKLYRGNRTSKRNAEHFDAFRSDNYPPLAEVGIHIKYNYPYIHYPVNNCKLKVYSKLNCNVAILKIFPGINKNLIESILTTDNLKAVIIETYGAGNAPTDTWFIKLISQAIKKDIIFLNITQCTAGSVDMGRYETSVELLKAGIVSGHDMTTEAAITKLMYLLGRDIENKKIINLIEKSISGELSELN